MQTRTFELDTADGPMPVYEARPDGSASRAVLVIQEAFGVNEHIQDVTRRFAEAGYHALAPHFFHRTGAATAPYGDFDRVRELIEGLDDDGVLRDADAAIEYLTAEHGFTTGALGAVGFCFGGRATFLLAARRDLGAAVGFYGGGIVSGDSTRFPPLVGESDRLRTPWLGLFGERDPSIPLEDVETLERALEDAPVTTQIVRYPEAGHGFHCDGRDVYHETSAKDAWARTLEFFERHLAT